MYIYILTNKMNGKQYVGQSINDPLKTGGRVYEHFRRSKKHPNLYLSNAIRIETRRKLSEGQIGKKNHNYGKTASLHTREKMSAAHKETWSRRKEAERNNSPQLYLFKKGN